MLALLDSTYAGWDARPMIHVSAALLHRQIVAVFTCWGMAADAAAAAADVMVETDLSGVDSHGIGMLPHYQRLFAEGRLDPKAAPVVLRDNPCMVLVDARHGLGHVAALKAMELAIEKARQSGLGLAGVTGSNHYGAAGYYARMAAGHGLLAISLTNAPSPLLVPVFGREAALGTNPIAFAAPTAAAERPVLLDMATTTVAYGKVSIARRAGKRLPEGWALDAEGRPETDAAVAAEARRLAPLGGSREQGGHKGYGLALMVEILCATLTGAQASAQETGHFFLVIDPGFFRSTDAFQGDMAALLARLRGITPVDLAQPVLIPGDPEHAALERRRAAGIPLVPTLVEEVRAVCAQCGAPFLLGDGSA
ncbi:Ldh family oxidoreductase [Roseomonas hellenica]|uniref:Ldh family oxidoreductase n=1 Tax=Plastoroseomonas hellenica TaxID=2687306 RepID=A0ABS5F8N5_9PROT|nr:Ldh family oxidoreductase [Plastoroseomonas hellenica]MBR0668923.1 Ldh family oxidoreductase [Plastoroseomonas hellenica]